MNAVNLFLFPFLVSAVFSYLSTPFVIKFAKKYKLIDNPKVDKHPKKIHKKTLPRAGGLAVLIAIIVSNLIFLPIDKHIIGILVGLLILLVLGLLDDKYNLNPYLRLLIQFLAASAPIIAGVGISFISNPLGGIIDLSNPQISFEIFGMTKTIWVLSDLFALVWIVSLMNFLNMGAKGINGQLPGVVVISSITIALLSLQYSADITQWPVIILAAITAGAYLGFLPFNFFPQKILPGFSGSSIAGFMLGVLSILSTTKVGTLIVVLGIPLIDTSYTIARRITSGKSPVWGDTGHLHHRLLKAGLSKRKVTYFYWLTTALLGTLALSLNTSNKLYTMVGVGVFVGGLLLWSTRKEK